MRNQNDRAAIADSVAVVGRILTAAAVLFAVSIGVFGSSNIVVLKILGIGTAVAVLADAVFVRCLLLPASLSLLGRRAWWLPPALRRLHQRGGRDELCPEPVPERR
jgi:RND superfamily putative drug exporter